MFTDWMFDVAPFILWLPALDGEMTRRSLSADVDLSMGDTLEAWFDNFKFAATGRAEPRKGNGLLTLGLMYLDLEQNTQTDIGVDTNIMCTVHAANTDHPWEVYRFFHDQLKTQFI